MYADPFDYVAAGSWEEAVRLLAEGGEDAKVLAGGQSLIPILTLRLASPRLLVDVNGAGDGRIERADGEVRLSAVARHSSVEASPLLRESCPLLARAASMVGNVRVRHRGTIGGSLAHADPAAELPCAVLALGGTMTVLGPEGERRIPADGFFDTYFTTALGPGEVLTEVTVPAVARGAGWSFQELVLRASDFAVVAVAALVETGPDGRCVSVRLAAAGVGERPVDLSETAAAVLLGETLTEASVAEVGRRAAASVEPSPSVHASAGYRRAMLEVFTRRALVEAAGRAGREAA